MSSYATGKIYKITSPNTDKIYIGSTTTSLHRRMINHKHYYKHQKENSSKHMFDSGDPQIELIEEYPCDSKKELLLREQYYMDLYKHCICNDRPAVGDKKAYWRAYSKSERGKAIKQKWIDDHKEGMKEYHRERAKLPHAVETRRKYRETHKLEKSIGDKKYREKNREKIQLRKKQYYDWINSMGGDYRYNNNIIRIDPSLFS
jgi:hypothetical protein